MSRHERLNILDDGDVIAYRNSEEDLPSFDEAEMNLEEHRLFKIHHFLADQGELSVDQIFHFLSAEFESDFMKTTPLFDSASSLTDFINARTFIFAYDFHTGKVRNRTFEYRAYFINLADFVYRRNSNLCSKVDFVKSLDPSSAIARGLGMTNRYDREHNAIKKFLGEHASIFKQFRNNTGHEKISLSDDCLRTIPSLLRKKLLPVLEKGPFWDKSNMFAFIGYVVSSTNNYAKAQIVAGPDEGKSVYVLCNNVNMGQFNMSERFPVGTQVEVLAHLTYNVANHFSAVKIHERDPQRDTLMWKIKYTDMRSLREKLAQAAQKTSASERISTAENIRLVEKEVTALLEQERMQILMLNSKLGGEPCALEEISMAVLQHRVFPLPEDVVEFVHERPHIYRIFMGDDGTRSICLRNSVESGVLLDVLKLIDSRKPFGINKKMLYAEIKAGRCGSALQEEILRDGVFDCMLAEIAPVLKNMLRDDDRYISVVGTFYNGHFFPRLFF